MSRISSLRKAVGGLLLLVIQCQSTFGQQAEGDAAAHLFWNKHSHRFIYPPAFVASGRDYATAYRYTVKSLTDGSSSTFEEATPDHSLRPIWAEIPVDSMLLLVDAVKLNGDAVPVGERRFIKSPGFSREVWMASEADSMREGSFKDAGRRSLEALYESDRVQHWVDPGGPNPDYPLWVYPSKVMGATIRGLVAYSRIVDDPRRSDSAAAIAGTIADFMLSLREGPGRPLAGWPPVHWRGVDPGNHPVFEGEFMVQFPAEAAWSLLDLYDLVRDPIYLEAVLAIADRYASTQRDDGTWYLLLDGETGRPRRRTNPVVPTYMIELFDRLQDEFGIDRFAGARERAFDWIMGNPVASFAWEAQFEDTRPKPSFENLAYREAAHTAKLLFADASTVRLAETILRFVEDQFVVWAPDDPILFRNWFSTKNRHWNGNDPDMGKDWFLPAVLEQYAFYTPISGAAATVMDVYVSAYRATHEVEYLAKAAALATSIVRAQTHHGGKEIPTHMRRTLPETNWTNVGVWSAMKLIEHDSVLTTGALAEFRNSQ